VSEYFLRKYRPVADALLAAHGLTVPDATRDMLADAMTHNRELPRRESESRGGHSALPALRAARTHASKLIEYADHPPARKASVPLHCAKLASAIRSNESLVGINLVLADPPIDPNALLDALDSGSFDVDVLRELVRVADAVEAESGGVGRPWAAHTTIIRSGCIAWERAGRVVTCSWNRKSGANNGKLTGPLPAFLRDLIACCDGTHEFTKAKPRRVPAGYRAPGPIPKGNMLRERVPDYVLRDGIYAWRKWSKAHPAKS
jgi:hypothetical protein